MAQSTTVPPSAQFSRLSGSGAGMLGGAAPVMRSGGGGGSFSLSPSGPRRSLNGGLSPRSSFSNADSGAALPRPSMIQAATSTPESSSAESSQAAPSVLASPVKLNFAAMLRMTGDPHKNTYLDPNRTRSLRQSAPPVVAKVPSDLIVYTKKERILDCMKLNITQPSYSKNSPSEELVLEYVEDFRRQFTSLFPYRAPLLLAPQNEVNVRKFICTTIRPTQLPFQDLTNLQACALFVADFLDYLPLDVPTMLPDIVPSPSTIVKMRAGDCVDFAILLCSLLKGNAYDAYVVIGYAPKHVTMLDLSNEPCPFLDNSLDFDVWDDKWWGFDQYNEETSNNAQRELTNAKILGGGVLGKDSQGGSGDLVPRRRSSTSGLPAGGAASNNRSSRQRDGAGSAGHTRQATRIGSAGSSPGDEADEGATGANPSTDPSSGTNPSSSGYELGPEDLAKINSITYEVTPPPIHNSKFIEHLEYEYKAVEALKQKDAEAAAAAEAAKIRPNDPLAKSRVHAWVMVRPGRRGVTETVFVEPTTGKIMPASQSHYVGIESVFNDTNYWVNMQVHEDNGLYAMSEMNFDLDDTTAWEFVLFDERKAQLANASDNFTRVTRNINPTAQGLLSSEATRTIVGKRPIARPIAPGIPSSSMTEDVSTPLAYMSAPSASSGSSPSSGNSGSSSTSLASVFRSDGTDGPLKPGVSSEYGVSGKLPTTSVSGASGQAIVDLPPTWTQRIVIDYQTYLDRFPAKKKKQVYKNCIVDRYREYDEAEQGLVLKLSLFDPDTVIPGFTDLSQGEDLYGDGYATALLAMQDEASTEIRIYKHREDRLLKSIHYRKEDRIRNEYGPGRQEGLMEFIQISSKQRIFKFYPRSRSDGMVMRLELDHKVVELYEGCINRLCYRSVAVDADKQNVRGQGNVNPGAVQAAGVGRSRAVKSAMLALARGNELPIRKITEKFERNPAVDAEEDVRKRTHYIQESLIRIDFHRPQGMLTGSVMVIDKDDTRNNRASSASSSGASSWSVRGNADPLSSGARSTTPTSTPSMLSSAGMRIAGVTLLPIAGKDVPAGIGSIARTYEYRVTKDWKAPPAGVRRKWIEKILETERLLVEEIREREKRMSEALQRLDHNGVQLIKALHVQALQMPDLPSQQAGGRYGKADSKVADPDDEGDLRYVYVQGSLYSSKFQPDRDGEEAGSTSDKLDPRNKLRGKGKGKGATLDRSILSDPLALYTSKWIGNPTRKQAQEAYDNCLAECRERMLERAQTIQAHYDRENQRLNQLQLQLKRSAAIGGEPSASTAQLTREADECVFRLQVLRQRLDEHNRKSVAKYAELQAKLEAHPLLQILRQPPTENEAK